MRWLITGGCGFIGLGLISTLLKDDGNSIRVLDNLSVGKREDLFDLAPDKDLHSDSDFGSWEERLMLVEGDILDAELAQKATTEADFVVHLAANTGVQPSVEDPQFDCKVNITGTLNMLEACRSNSVGRFVFASSGAPLGVQTPPLNEEMAPHPASPYGASKLAGEAYCSAYFHCFGVETVALRFGNVYGEGSHNKSSVVAKFITRSLAGKSLEIYGDGGQTRDFIHLSDLIDAIIKATVSPGVGGETFQIATSTETTVLEMTQELKDVFTEEGIEFPDIVFAEMRAGDVIRNWSDTTKAREQLNWTAQIPLKQGLRRTVRHFLDRQQTRESV